MPKLLTPETESAISGAAKECGRALGIWCKRHSTQLLTAGAVIGTFSTGFAVWKARPYADSAISKAEEEKGEPLTWKEKLKVSFKYYIPAVVTAVAGSTCAVSAEVRNKNTQEALAGAAAMISTSYSALKNNIDKKYGEGAAKELEWESVKADDKYVIHSNGWTSSPGLGHLDDRKIIVYDDFSRRKYETTIGRVLDAQIGMTTQFQTHGEVGLREWYEMVGVYDSFPKASRDIIDELGWTYEGQNEINCDSGFYPFEYEIREMDGEEICVIFFHTPPYPMWYDLDYDLYGSVTPKIKTHLDEV